MSLKSHESSPISLCSACLPKYGGRTMSFGDMRTGQCDSCGKNGIAVMDLLVGQEPKECPYCGKDFYNSESQFCLEDCEEDYNKAIGG